MPQSLQNSARTVAEDLQRALRLLTAATIVLYLICIGVAVKVYTDSRSTTDALCTLRTDLVKRVNSSRNFLKDHPNGVSGISPKVIIDGIDNQQRSIEALKGLDCPPTP